LVEDPTYKFNTYSLLIVLYFENKNWLVVRLK
jgi:hypothetical protein